MGVLYMFFDHRWPWTRSILIVSSLSPYLIGLHLVFDSTGSLLTKENTNRICASLMPYLIVLINVFFEKLTNGITHEVMLNATRCFDTGLSSGGWAHVVLR
jgi:hypothetical protein